MVTATKEPAVLADRYHLENCPQPEGRVEEFDATRPPRPAKGEAAQTMTVTRCMECGGQRVREKS